MLNRLRLPNFSYNSATGILTPQFTSSPVHKTLVSTIYTGLTNAVKSLPRDIQLSITIVTNEGFMGFKGVYLHSEKIPDVAIRKRDSQGISRIKFIVEVGFSETYEKLVEDARLWLEGTSTVSMVLIIKLEEVPGYKSPLTNLTDNEFDRLNFPPLTEINDERFVFDGPYGPVRYKGLQWCGVVTGFLEFWAIHRVTRLAQQITSRMVSHTLPHP